MSGFGFPTGARISSWRLICGVTVLCGAGVASDAVAQEVDFGRNALDYPTCMAIAVDQFETALTRSRNTQAAPNFDLVMRDPFDYCGVLAIVQCDRSAEPERCKEALAVEQLALREAILASVPAPEVVAGRDPIWSDGLYPQLWEVAHGSSAGPDCDGADAAYAAWCATRQASLKVAEAVSLWQVARLLGAAETAVEAGWASPAPPPEPVQRP